MPETISLLYRDEKIRFTPVDLQWLGSYFRTLHSAILRDFTTDLRVLFKNIKQAASGFELCYEASHITNNETGRFRCEELYRCLTEPTQGNHFELTLHPTDVEERNVILGFHEQNGKTPIGCDELLAKIREYVKDPETKEKLFDSRISCVSVLRCINDFLYHWRGSVSTQQLKFETGENGSLNLSAVLTIGSTSAYCFCITMNIG